MADVQRKVSLIFEANASQAKNEINSLVQSLQKIQSTPYSLIDPKGIREASKAALELQGHIRKAIDVDTGKLDLSRFAASLKTSGKGLESYRDALNRIGPEGTAAFASVLKGINNAEVSTVRLTKGMRDFITTMKNTVKWQISSSIMHGLIGGMQSAFGYAKALDASLNNIRIVTGHSAEQMARFAVEANRSAQALSTTTTKYTDAALIFYQQGLGDKAVKERTDAVIKMANVTGEAAADVSSYMTAIWNNFDNGSKSLEYYADVITKLGAATAASSEEIAGGLEKFAAIGNTIGLSYEYATSMITTIVDKTRQSEDVVGTALKTILARIQGLSLGETLEDGTDLNKYSEALASVGVNIKDTSGQLKDMDIILDSLGSKWGTFSKDTQVALAQVVGGVRQYNQIIALMDNWSSFQQNVSLAETATGTLDEQANIYAESWEAAHNRIRVAAEGIYDALINEDVFIKLSDIFAGLLNGVSGVIKGMGGMMPILGTIGGIITQKFAKEMPVALNNMKQNFMVLTGQANKEALKVQQTNTLLAQDMVNRADDSYEASQFESIRRVSKMKEELIKNQHRMNSAQIEEYQALIQNEQAVRNIIDERAKSLALLEEEVQTMKEMLSIETAMNASDEQMEDMFGEEAEEDIKKVKDTDKYKALKEKERYHAGEMLKPTEDGTSDDYKRHAAELQNIRNQLSVMEDKSILVFEKYSQYIQSAAGELADFSAQQSIATRNANNLNKFLEPNNIKAYEGNLNGLKATLEAWNTTSFQSEASAKFLKEALDALGKEGAEEAEVMKIVTEAIKKMAEAEAQAAANAKLSADAKAQELIKTGVDPKTLLAFRNKSGRLGPLREANLEGNEPKGPEIKPRGNIEVLTQAAGTLMSAYSALNAVVSASNTLMDENATAMEKVGAVIGVLTSLTFAATSVIGLYNTLKDSQIVKNIKETGTKLASIQATTAEGVAYGFLTKQIIKAKVAMGGFMSSHPIGWIVGITAAVVALGVALANIDWRSEEEKKIDELIGLSNGLSKAQEHLKETIQEVESAWENYQNFVEILDDCTVGTEAWNEALRDVNQSILDLIKASPELAKLVQFDANGRPYLGGIEYERYIKEQQRLSQLINAEKTIAEATISDIKNQEHLYGTQSQQESLMKFWKEQGPISEWRIEGESEENIKDQSNIIKNNLFKLLNEVFQGNEENFKKYLQNSNIIGAILMDGYTTTAEQLIEYINKTENEYPPLGLNSYVAKSSVSTLESEWIQALGVRHTNQVQKDIAYRDIFSGISGFEIENLGLYVSILEPLMENELQRIKSEQNVAQTLSQYEEYMNYNKGELTLAGEKILYAGEEIEGLTIASVEAAVALGNISRNAELLNNTVSQGNLQLEGMTNYAKNMIRSGEIHSGYLSAGKQSETYEKAKVYNPQLIENSTPEEFSILELPGLIFPNAVMDLAENLSTLQSEYNDLEAKRNELEAQEFSFPEEPELEVFDITTEDYDAKIATYQDHLTQWDRAAKRQEDFWTENLPHLSFEDAPNILKNVESYMAENEEFLAAQEAYYLARYDHLAYISDGFYDPSYIDEMIKISELMGFEYGSRAIPTEYVDYTNEEEAFNQAQQSLEEAGIPYTPDEIELILQYGDIPTPAESLPYGSREEIEELKTQTEEDREIQAANEQAQAAIRQQFEAESAEITASIKQQESDIQNVSAAMASNEEELKGKISELANLLVEFLNIDDFNVAENLIRGQLEESGSINLDSIINNYGYRPDYEAWYSNMSERYGSEWLQKLEIPDDLAATNKGVYDWFQDEDNQDTIFKSFNQDAIESLENIIGMSIEDFDLGEGKDDLTYEEKFNEILALVSNKDSEFYADYNRESVLAALFEEDADESLLDEYRGENGLSKFLEKFGKYLFTEEELQDKDSIDWSIILEKINESISQNNKNVYDEWITGEKRWVEAVTYNEEDKTVEVNRDKSGGKVAEALLSKEALSPQNINLLNNILGEISGGLGDVNLGAFELELSKLISSSGNATGVLQAIDLAIGKVISTGEDLTSAEFIETLSKMGMDTSMFEGNVESFVDVINTAASTMRSFTNSVDGLINSLNEGKKVTDKLQEGADITVEEYEKIEKYLTDEQKKNLVRTLEGYRYYGDEEELRAINSQIYNRSWEDYREGAKKVQEKGEEIEGLDDFSSKRLEQDDQVYTQADIGNWLFANQPETEMSRFISQQEQFKEFGVAYGLGEGNIEAFTNAFATGQIINENGVLTATSEEAQALLSVGNALMTAIADYTLGNFKEGSLEAQQVAMTSADSTEELERRVKEGDIVVGDGGVSQEQYDDTYNQLQLDEYETNFELDKEEVDALGNSIQQMVEGMSEAELEAMGLSKALADNEILADELAKKLKRYNRAVDKITDSYEDWKKAINSDDWEESSEAISEVKDTVEDMLDLPMDALDELALSAEDATEMLELMERVATGDIDALDELQALTAEKYIIKGEVQTNFDQTSFNEAANQLATAYDDLPVGEPIIIGKDSQVDSSFWAACSEILAGFAATEAGAAQAEAAFEALGYDAEVEAVTVPVDQAFVIPPTLAPGGNVPYGLSTDGAFFSNVTVAEEGHVEHVSGEQKVLAIKSITPNGNGFGGNVGTRESRRGRGGGGGGGGGGGRRPRAERKGDSDRTRYNYIENRLEDLSRAYDKVSTAADRAFGPSRVKYIKQQQKAVEDLITSQQDYVTEIEDYFEQDRQALEEVAQYTGIEFDFDENGSIRNYDEIEAMLMEKYNAYIDENGVVQGMSDKEWEEFEKKHEEMFRLIEQYQETQDLLAEQRAQLQEYINQLIDLQLAEITAEIEFKLQVDDESLALLEFFLGKIEDDAWAAAEAIALLGERTDDIISKSNTYNEGFEKLIMNMTKPIKNSKGEVVQEARLTEEQANAILGVGDEKDPIAQMEARIAALSTILSADTQMTEAEYQTLLEYKNGLIEMSQQLIEVREQVHATVLESFEAFNEEMDGVIERMRHLNEIANNYRNIIDLVGKKNLDISNALIESLGQQNVEQSIDILNASRTRLETMRNEISMAEEALANLRSSGGSEEDIKKWEENLEEMQESLEEAEADFMGSWEETLTAINDQFILSVTNAVERLSDALAGPLLGSVEELQNLFDRQATVSERYLPDYEKIYELSKLNRDITKSIDDTENVHSKQELMKLQAEINALQESGAEISQYEAENLRRIYELKLAELALEEAQNAKSEVRMSRTADGSWSYIYTANEEQVAEAEQSYEDKLFAIQQANSEYIQELQNNLVQLQADMISEIEAIMNDETLSIEERYKKADEAAEFYKDQEKYTESQLTTSLQNNSMLYDNEWRKYSELTGYKISANHLFVDDFKETTLAVHTGFNTMLEYQTNFNNAIGAPGAGGLLDDLTNSYQSWQSNTELAFEAAGTNMTEYSTLAQEEINNITSSTKLLEDEMTILSEKVEDTFEDIVDSAEAWALKYGTEIDKYIAKSEELATSLQKVLDLMKETGFVDTEDPEDPDDPNPPPPGPEKYDFTITGKKFAIFSDLTKNNKGKTKIKSVKKNETISGNFVRDEEGRPISAGQFYKVLYNGQEAWIKGKILGIKPAKITGIGELNTGGYTGDWNTSEGKIAMLHEKELVLNKSDTANFLKGIGILRQISDTIDLNALYSAGQNFNIFKGLGMNSLNSGTLEQSVSITANFPNVDNKEQILDAFNELINLASQYANRK